MGETLSILVVEDDSSVRRALVRILSAHGRVESSATFADSRSKIRQGRFDVAVIDVNLPDGLGIDLLEPLRVRNAAVVTLVMTGITQHAIIKRAHENGARYLLKPVDADQLKLVVDDAKARKKAAERRTRVTLQRWIEDYKLSYVEAELLELGTEGVPREEFARLRLVRPDTIRKQVQALIRKTGHDTFEAAVNAVLREALSEPT